MARYKVDPTAWFERKFPSIDDTGRLPTLVERLISTPLRLTAKVSGITDLNLEVGKSGRWSVKEEIGHLVTLEPLWLGRVHDILQEELILREADLTNQATFDGNFNEWDVDELVRAFREERIRLTAALEQLSSFDLEKSSLHPRLKIRMKIVDLAFFIAEHDDHHLVRIGNLL
ncbi:MAG: DinB family protein [Saprospiraceae bacterium]|nr:DinB family protein [Saprospiraceae bacterium]